MKLTAENVENLFEKCLRDEDGNFVEGVMAKACMNVTGHEEDIKSMLAELSDDFKQGSGGGQSFLNLCFTKEKIQWTDLQARMDKLVMLGIAANAEGVK